ncbi:hypothetical protein BDR22DRAFT_885635 [Usnea florida]
MAFKGVQGVALITGAAGGIGREATLAFAEAGASGIIFADLDEAGAHDSAEQSKSLASHSEYRYLVVHVDITDAESVQAMVDAAVKEFGRIDYSVNCAGIGTSSKLPIADASVEEFDKLAHVNTRGTMLCVRAVSKAMSTQEPLTYQGRHGQRSLGRGSIINITSVMSFVGNRGKLPYVASKHAVMGMTKTAALDNTPHHIRVNAICPAWVDTPMMARDFAKSPDLKNVINAISPVGRMAVPEEIGDVIVFLSSASASYINGQGLIVDAGVSLTVNRM